MPPAGNGTMNLTGLLGNAPCAETSAGSAISASRTAANLVRMYGSSRCDLAGADRRCPGSKAVKQRGVVAHDAFREIGGRQRRQELVDQCVVGQRAVGRLQRCALLLLVRRRMRPV